MPTLSNPTSQTQVQMVILCSGTANLNGNSTRPLTGRHCSAEELRFCIHQRGEEEIEDVAGEEKLVKPGT